MAIPVSIEALAQPANFASYARAKPSVTSGQSATLLADGRWLLLGGLKEGVVQAGAAILVAANGPVLSLPQSLVHARAGHTATVLPDGTVLVFGGVGPDGYVVREAERFDPKAQSFAPLPETGLMPRSRHTATLLTDGRVLLAGGLSESGRPLSAADLWNPATGYAEAIKADLLPARYGQAAALLPNDPVLLWGGQDSDGQAVGGADLYLPAAQRFATLDVQVDNPLPAQLFAASAPAVQATMPVAEAANVPIDSRVVVRFAKPLQPDTLNTATVTLFGPSGPVVVKVVAAEGGLLLFVTPPMPLLPATRYTLFVNGAADDAGRALPFTTLGFRTEALLAENGTAKKSGNVVTPATTVSSATASVQPTVLPTVKAELQAKINTATAMTVAEAAKAVADGDSWQPGPEHFRGSWRSGRGTSPLQSLPPLQAPFGTTALAGQVLRLNGQALDNVSLVLDGQTVRTDATGRFLLSGVKAGQQVLVIDGHTAKQGHKTYGVFEVKVELGAGKTNILNYTIWMPVLDTAHALSLPSPTTSEVVATTPAIPGLELHIPPGTVIRDRAGQVVTQVSITAIPIDQPPFPLPPSAVPVYFSVQPGGAYLQTLNGQAAIGARLIYPNFTHDAPRTRMDFWNYDSVEKGWYVYGQGRVSNDGTQIIPEPGVVLYEFSGAMVTVPNLSPPGNGPPPGGGQGRPGLDPHNNGGGDGTRGQPPCAQGGSGGGDCGNPAKDGEPVDLATGLFVHEKTDLVIQDTLPLVLTRTYRQGDTAVRPFGVGSNFSYGIFLWSANQYQEADLVLPDGGKVHYVRTSPGTGYTDAIFESTATPSAFYKSRIVWNGLGWDLTLKDGMVYVFGENQPLQAIRDRYGNTVTLTRASGGQSGNITRVTSPNGRWIDFTYDTSSRITQIKDNVGRTVGYTYDASGRLWKVTDPGGGITEYTYDTSHRMLTVKNPKGAVYLTNAYDGNGRVSKQTLADSGIYQFAYTLDTAGKVTRTDVTDPRSIVRRVTFNASGYPLSDTRAQGKPEQQVFSYTRQAGSNLLLTSTDPLGRVTAYAYDGTGNVKSVTRLSGTAEAVTTSYTYEPAFNQAASVTDPLQHTTRFTYDGRGSLQQITDALGRQSNFTYTYDGQLASVSDPLGHTSRFDYDLGDLVGVTDALGNRASRFVNSLGRVVAVADPLGNQSRVDYDAFGRVSKVTDPLGQATRFAYDANGNLLSVTDARGSATKYTYDTKNRPATRSDPLLKAETYGYDLADNLTSVTDRRGSVTKYTYDALGRRTFAGYGASGTSYASTATYTYDAGNRLTKVVDSQSGTLTRSYDNLDRLSGESTPQGSVAYTYDAAGRRTRLTVAGQSAVSYAYDNGNQLAGITQGTSAVGFTYDGAGRRGTLTLPNGVVLSYGYDSADRLTSLSYQKGANALGNLTYTYDAAGRRTAVGGSLARTGLPAALASATYNAANRLGNWSGKALSYDANGNLSSDGTATYTWDERNRLAKISQGTTPVASFAYDPLGRRTAKTVGGITTGYLYDGLNAVQELSGSTPKANLLTGLGIDEVFTRTDSSGARHFLGDALGSTVALTDAAGAVQTSYTYEPYGQTTASGAASGNPVQYTGRENDGTGLYYYRARYYHPGMQRFVSEDPIGFAGGINLYSYVGGSPLGYSDPLGLDRQATGPAVVITDMSGGRTVFFDPQNPSSYTEIQSSNKVTRAAHARDADTPYHGKVTICQRGRLGAPYGTAKLRTTDPRSRWVHGGGSGLPDPYAPQQGWKPTEGCTRAQNEDVEELCDAVEEYQQSHPGVQIPYGRF